MGLIKNLFSRDKEATYVPLNPAHAGKPTPEARPAVSQTLLANTSKDWPPTADNSNRRSVPPTTQPPTAAPVPPEKVTAVTQPTTPATVPGDLTTALAHFRKAVFSIPTPFLEMVKVADRLKEYIPDDAVRQRAALKILEGEEFDLSVVKRSIDTHLTSLDAELKRVLDKVDEATTTKVTQLTASITTLETENEGLDAQLASLHDSINRLIKAKTANADEIKRLQGTIKETTDAEPTDIIAAADMIEKDLLAKRTMIEQG